MEQHQPQPEILDREDTRAGSDRPVQFDLAALRTARGVAQKAIAARLELNPSGVSRYEAARDPRLSTVRGYVEAMGGRLISVAVFENADGTQSRYLIKPAGKAR
jgi:transcriptional regulator with XRE-family HTH domain